MDIQRFTVEYNYPTFSRPMTHDQFLAELQGAKVETAERGYYD